MNPSSIKKTLIKPIKMRFSSLFLLRVIVNPCTTCFSFVFARVGGNFGSLFFTFLLTLCGHHFLRAAELTLPPHLLCSSVLIVLDDGSSGSGFFLEDRGKIFFVTARHVLGDLDSAGVLQIADRADLFFYPHNVLTDKQATISLNLLAVSREGLIRFGIQRDVAVIYLGEVTADTGGLAVIRYSPHVTNKSTFIPLLSTKQQTRNYHDAAIGNVIYLFGYPSTLGLMRQPQFDYQRPLLRRGVIAGKYLEKQTIVIDCPIYHGNSGGPVWEKVEDDPNTNFYLLGIAIEYVPYIQEFKNLREGITNYEVNNSGYSIVTSIDYVIELMRSFKK